VAGALQVEGVRKGVTAVAALVEAALEVMTRIPVGKKGGNGSDSSGDHAGPSGRGKDKCRAYGKIGHWA
jgi:hypothetical protein